jgi:hypothetical protein
MLHEFSEPKLFVTFFTVLTTQPDAPVGATVGSTGVGGDGVGGDGVGPSVGLSVGLEVCAAVGKVVGLLVKGMVGAVVGAAVIGAAVVTGPEPPPTTMVSTTDFPAVKVSQYLVPAIVI